MAINKKSFVLYSDLIHKIDHLTDEEKGRLFWHIIEYVNDKDPVLQNRILLTAWKPIEQQLKADLKKWENRAQRSRDNGSKGGRPKKTQKTQQVNLKPTKPDTDNVTVTVTGNDTDNVNDPLKKYTKFIFRSALIDYGFNSDLVSDWLKVRAKKKAANTQTAYKSFIKQVELAMAKGYDKNEILELCAANSWQGFKADWIDTKTNTKTKTDEQLQREIRDELKDEGIID